MQPSQSGVVGKVLIDVHDSVRRESVAYVASVLRG